MSLGKGFGVGFRWGVGGGLLVGNERRQRGVRILGAGVGTGKGTGKPMRMRLSKLPLFCKLTERGTLAVTPGQVSQDNRPSRGFSRILCATVAKRSGHGVFGARARVLRVSSMWSK